MRQRIAFTVMDGGLSTVPDAHRFDPRHPLRAGRLITESPAVLVEAHRACLRAGAEVVITTSYRAGVAGLDEMGLTRSGTGRQLRWTTTLAREAVRRDGSAALVAASVFPCGATRADGAEYRGDDDVAGLA